MVGYLAYHGDERLVPDAQRTFKDALQYSVDHPREPWPWPADAKTLPLDNRPQDPQQVDLSRRASLFTRYVMVGGFPDGLKELRTLVWKADDISLVTGFLYDLDHSYDSSWPYPRTLADHDWILETLRGLIRRKEYSEDPEWKWRRTPGFIDSVARKWEDRREAYLKAHPEQASSTPNSGGASSQNPPPPVGPDNGNSPPDSGQARPPRPAADKHTGAEDEASGAGGWMLWLTLAAAGVSVAILILRRRR